MKSEDVYKKGRRGFIWDMTRIAAGTAVGVTLFDGCHKSSEDINTDWKEVERIGVSAITEAINEFATYNNFGLGVGNNLDIYTKQTGFYDVVAFLDTNNSGRHDFVIGANYLIPGDTRYNIDDLDRIRTWERNYSENDTHKIIKKEFRDWLDKIDYS